MEDDKTETEFTGLTKAEKGLREGIVAERKKRQAAERRVKELEEQLQQRQVDELTTTKEP